jgi:hypothetical protein
MSINRQESCRIAADCAASGAPLFGQNSAGEVQEARAALADLQAAVQTNLLPVACDVVAITMQDFGLAPQENLRGDKCGEGNSPERAIRRCRGHSDF